MQVRTGPDRSAYSSPVIRMPDGRNKSSSAATRSAVSRARASALSGSEWAPEALPELAALMTAGRLTVPVWRGYPLAQAAAAHADLEAQRNHGKIILIP